jgi:site-specific recombinase XerD
MYRVMTGGSISEYTLEELLPSWKRALRAETKSPRTIESYFLAADQLVAYLADNGHSTIANEVTHREIQDYLVMMLDTRASSTAKQRYASLQQLFKWLYSEGEIEANPFDRIKKPKIEETPVPIVTKPERAALLRACKDGPKFEQVRDVAVIRTLTNTGMRLSELVGMAVDDVDLDHETVTVLGKGRKLRTISLGANTVAALDRYQRERGRHRLSDRPEWWLGLRGPLTASGVAQILARRSDAAGLDRIHPHQFRHSFAHEWVRAGGPETDLMRIMGWDSPQMLQRYGASAASERAREVHRNLGIGDD